jgi:hypothetical protein
VGLQRVAVIDAHRVLVKDVLRISMGRRVSKPGIRDLSSVSRCDAAADLVPRFELP